MDSNPPFQVEDQTDEDFFNKLVDDDDEVKVHASSTLAEGNDSDDTRALASLSIGDVPAGLEDSGWEGESGIEAIGETACENTNAVSLDGHADENSSRLSSSSLGFDSVIESIGGATGAELTSDSTVSNGSGGSGIKEVQWTAFNSNSGQSNRFGSYSDFFSELGDGAPEPHRKVEDSFGVVAMTGSGSGDVKGNYNENYNSTQYQESGAYNSGMVHNVDGQDQCNTQYWENLYPGWKYDVNTGQWYQVDSHDPTANVQESLGSNSVHHSAGAGGNSHDSYLQQTSQVSAGTVTKNDTANSVNDWNQISQGNVGSESVSNWNQTAQVNTEYPAHMVFDPQYPGWYYDTIAQEWCLLETYTSSVQSSNQSHNQQNQNGYPSTVASSQDNHQTYVGSGQVDNSRSQGFAALKQDHNWAGSSNNYNQNNLNMWQPDNIAKRETSMNFSGNQQSENDYGFKNQKENDYDSKFPVTNHASQQKSYDSRGAVPYYREANEGHNDFLTTGSSSFSSTGNFIQHTNQPSMQKNDQRHLSNGYYANQSSGNFSQQQLQSGNQFSYAPDAGRSSAGRPPHALVTFGFGGKLIMAKYDSSFNAPSYETQGPVGSSISVLNLMEVVSGKIDAPNMASSIFNYFNTLCKQSYPGPLVGGSVGNKELNKWVDERIASCGFSDVDYRKDEVLKLLLSLLKIACQYYGKLRSPFGSDTALRESDYPESAVARLFSSAKENSAQFSNYGGIAHCLQKSPSEAQMLATASEVQSLLVSGKKKEALHCATEGQLWGPALVLATQLGEQFYVDTVKQMALRQLVAGSPLRTLCLLIAGQPADVFSIETTSESSIPHAVNMTLQSTQRATNYMVDGWEENLAVITANRTKDDHLVLIHLGDCLWKERSEILAAHICYLVAEANFEQYSDSARLCLIGADHWKFPRTYASPDAIQRTELYEYAKVLGNPQFILLPFQPYKVIYAHMLAEVGKVTESLKYCQAVLKSLKAGRAPEADTCRQLISSLDERIRTYHQGGFSSNSTNLVSKKLVGKLFNFIDSTAHRVVGGLPPPVPSTSHGSPPATEHSYQTMGLRVSASQSTMAMSSLMPSASVEPINEWNSDGSRKPKHNRSVSEPDFGRTPIQDHADSSKQASSPDAQGKSSGGASRFGRFGFGSQLFQKTVGLVLKPRQDRQAKLGETNKFYYDEKLKRWVEEGAEAAADDAPLPPPPTGTAFQNGGSDYSLKGGLRSEGSPKVRSPEFKSPTPLDHGSGIPPIPPASNQFSARGRAGVRSRYVDTFNKGGGNASNLFQSPSVQTNAPTGGANPKFFVPTPASSTRGETSDTMTDNMLESTSTNEDSSMRTSTSSFHSPPAPASISIQRFPSMDNLAHKSATATASGTLPPHSRRTASWSGSFADGYSPHLQGTGVKPLGEVLGLPPSSFMPRVPSSGHMSMMNGGTIGEDLHEVDL